MKTETIKERLTREAAYAQRSLLRDMLFETYGKAEMARQLGAITLEEFMDINHMTIYFINTHAGALEMAGG